MASLCELCPSAEEVSDCCTLVCASTQLNGKHGYSFTMHMASPKYHQSTEKNWHDSRFAWQTWNSGFAQGNPWFMQISGLRGTHALLQISNTRHHVLVGRLTSVAALSLISSCSCCIDPSFKMHHFKQMVIWEVCNAPQQCSRWANHATIEQSLNSESKTIKFEILSWFTHTAPTLKWHLRN